MSGSFSLRLNEAMARCGYKQVDILRLAQEQGQKLGKSQLSQYINGKTVPRKPTVELLANLLDVSPAWLLAGEDKAVAATELPPQAAAPTKAPAQTDPQVAPEPTSQPASAAAAHAASQSEPESRQSEPANQEPAAKGHLVKEIKKSSKLDNVLYDVRGPVVDEANRMEQAGTHVLKLNIGNPAPFGFRTPDEVVYDMQRQLVDCEGYSPSKGLYSARKAIMQYAQIKELPNVDIEHIYTGNGVSELINLCMSALLDDGDEILIPSPDYPLWTACATLAGGVVKHYVCDEQADWYPDIDDMRSKITPRTKAIVIINPNNPTGALYPVPVLQQIVDLAREYGLMIFSDEIYDRLVMDGLQHTSIASLAPDLFCATFSGLSKSHMIAGYRVGWMVLSGDLDVARDFIEGLDMLSNMRLCSNVPAQSIVQTALWGHKSVKDYVVPGGRIYEQREYIYKALSNIPGISVVKPHAAFYIFPKLDVKKFNITDDVKFAVDLLKREHVLVVQGSGFNWKEPDHFRIVYLPRTEVLRDAMQKLEHFLFFYHQ